MPLGPLPVVSGAVRCRYVMTYSGRPAVNVFHLSYTGVAPNTGELSGVASALQSAWATNIRPQVNNTVGLNSTDVTDLSSRTGAYYQNTTASSGTLAGTALPNNVAMCVSFHTNYRFRGGHCRMYLPGRITADVLSGFNWVGTSITAAKAAMDAWLTALNAITGAAGGSYKLIMLSYFSHDAQHNPIYRPDGPQKYLVDATRIGARIDSQRRRLGKETS
jgi:hypothetical protein